MSISFGTSVVPNKLVLGCRNWIFGPHFLRFSSSLTKSKNVDEIFDLGELESDETAAELVSEIEAKRNKSGLSEKHRNILKGIPPPPGSDDFHTSLKYKRKIYGLYGSASGINPSTLYPDETDIGEIREYESVAHPYSFHEMVARARNKRSEEQRLIDARQKKIADNLKKVSQWMKEVEAKKDKKLKELADAKAKRDKMLDEVRRQIGYDVDMKDEKFKLALLQKEKDMKKKSKEEKTKAKQERLLKAMNQEATSQ